MKRQIFQTVFFPLVTSHAKLFIIFFLLSFSASLTLKWLMLASCFGHKRHTYVLVWVQVYLWSYLWSYVFVWVQVYLCVIRLCVSASVPLIARKTLLLLVSLIDIEDLCTFQNAILYRSTLFGHTYINVNHVLELLCWTTCSWLIILSYRPSSYRYWLCSIPLAALLWHYPCKIVDLLWLRDGY